MIPRVVRFSSAVPSSASMRLIRRLMIDFATPSRRAARANPRLVITSTNAHISCRSTIQSPRRTLNRGNRHVACVFVGRAESISWIGVKRGHSTARTPCIASGFAFLLPEKGRTDLWRHSKLLDAPREALIVHERFELFYVIPKMWDFVGILKVREAFQCGLDPVIRGVER